MPPRPVHSRTGEPIDRNGRSVPRTASLARSLTFNALFYASLIIQMIVALPILLLPRRVHLVFIRSYARTSLWLLRVVCGTTVEWRGLDKLPPRELWTAQ